MYSLSGHGLELEDIVHFYSYRSGSLVHRKEAEQSVSGPPSSFFNGSNMREHFGW